MLSVTACMDLYIHRAPVLILMNVPGDYILVTRMHAALTHMVK